MGNISKRYSMLLLSLFLAGTCLIGCDAAGENMGISLSGESQGEYKAPPMAVSEFHEDKATAEAGVSIDLSATADGYIGIKAVNEKRLKLEVSFGETKYLYDLSVDGTPTFIPLQFGNGTYALRVMQQTTGDKYIELLGKKVDVLLSSEFAPFIRPNQMTQYNADSDCVKMAGEYAANATDQLDFIKEVYKYVEKNITYDYDFAANPPKGYIPDPDKTLSSKKGICVDYASLVAAMLRSQGIPTKIVTGYVSPDDIYHAWNMIYTEENGWITVEIKAPKNEWQRIDLTFAANGADSQFIGDQSNYVEKYFY